MVGTNGQDQNGTHMPTPWDQFIGAIERRKSQLDDLLAAYANFRGKLDALPPEIAQEAQRILASGEAEKLQEESQRRNDLIGKTALECAQVILTELQNQPTHFSVIAKMAIARGYKGRIEGTPAEVESRLQNSFWAAMHRSKHFQSAGKGLYRLNVVHEHTDANSPQQPIGQEPENDSHHITQKEACKLVLTLLGRSARVSEILDVAQTRGFLKPTTVRRNLFNSLYGVMAKNRNVFKKVGTGEFDLVNRVTINDNPNCKIEPLA